MEWFKIFTSTGMVRVRTDEIVYVKADGNYCNLMLTNGSCHKMTFQLHFFEDYFKLLRNNTFVRVGRSLIVNKLYIYVISLPDQLMILNGTPIKQEIVLRGISLEKRQRDVQISRENLKQLMNLLAEEEGGTEND